MTDGGISVTAAVHGRPPRAAEGGLVYHVMNRADARAATFEDGGDYDAFLRVVAEAAACQLMRRGIKDSAELE